MVAVWHSLVTAVCTMGVGLLVCRTVVAGRTALRIVGAYSNRVVVYVSALGVMQTAVVKIIDVAVMLYRRMAAVRTVLVRMRIGLS